MKNKIFLSISTLIFSIAAIAQTPKTLLISDIDDTLKVAYSFGLLKGAQYFRNTEDRFVGMSELYELLQKDEPGLRTYYVSVAPEFLMKNTHLEFLKNGHFPEGVYIGRSHYSADEHKLETIRGILRQEKPNRVIMVGDDGQIDAAVYRQISEDGEFAGTEFHQFVHIVSSQQEDNGQAKISGVQTAYVTSVELAVEMGRQDLLQPSSVDAILQNILPKVLKERAYPDRGQVEFAFPYFQNCRAIVWKWNIPGLDERVKSACHLQ